MPVFARKNGSNYLLPHLPDTVALYLSLDSAAGMTW
jgi:hypothetical protein